jgi:hypothetical protein
MDNMTTTYPSGRPDEDAARPAAQPLRSGTTPAPDDGSDAAVRRGDPASGADESAKPWWWHWIRRG